MTLRDRRKPADEEIGSTPPARRMGRGRGGATPRDTPGRVKKEEKADSDMGVVVGEEPQGEIALVVDAKSDLAKPAAPMPTGSLGQGEFGAESESSTSIPVAFDSTPASLPSLPIQHGGISASAGSNDLASIPPLPSIPSMSSTTFISQPSTRAQPGDDATPACTAPLRSSITSEQSQKVFLRFTRPTSTEPPSQTLYPVLPVAVGSYRERGVSEGLSAESDSEYVSAKSDLSGDYDRTRQEL